MNKIKKWLMKAYEESILIDAWIAQCLNSDRQPRLSDLLFLGEFTGSYGDWIIYLDRLTGDYVSEFRRRD